MRNVRTRRVPLTLIAVTALTAAACSGDADPSWSLDEIEVGDGSVTEIDVFARFGSVSPDARLVAYKDGEELCIHAIGERRPDCVESLDASVERSISWSDDGSTALLTQDFVRFFQEPDVFELDTEDLELVVRSDDGIDARERLEDGALIDQMPFVGPDGSTHFFRSDYPEGGDRIDFELLKLDDDARDADDAEQVGSLDLPRGSFPIGPIRKLDADRWVLLGSDLDRRSQLFVVDLGDEAITEIDLDVDNAAIVDVAGGLVLVADAEALAQFEPGYSIIDVETERDRDVDIELEDGQVVTGIGFAPDASSIAVVVNDRTEEETELIAFPVDDGRAAEDDAVTLIRSRDFDDVRTDDMVISGFGSANEIIWADDGSIVLAADGTVITFEVTPA